MKKLLILITIPLIANARLDETIDQSESRYGKRIESIKPSATDLGLLLELDSGDDAYIEKVSYKINDICIEEIYYNKKCIVQTLIKNNDTAWTDQEVIKAIEINFPNADVNSYIKNDELKKTIHQENPKKSFNVSITLSDAKTHAFSYAEAIVSPIDGPKYWNKDTPGTPLVRLELRSFNYSSTLGIIRKIRFAEEKKKKEENAAKETENAKKSLKGI